MSDSSPRYDLGMQTRRKVLGADYVDVAQTNTTPFNAAFQTLITETAWGSVWSRETIPLRERSMLTIALLAAFGHYEELAMHVRATRNTGASLDDIKEALLHVAIYAGVPAANHAFKVVAQAYDEMSHSDVSKEDHHA